MAGFSGLTQAGSQIAMNLAGWCVLVLAIPMVASGRLEGIFLAMLPLCVGTSFEAVASLPLVFSYWEESRTAWKRLREVTEAPNYLFSQAHEPQSQARTLTQHLSLTQTLGQSQPQTQTPVPVQIPTPNSSTAKIPTLTPEPNPNPNKTGTQEKVISVPELTGQYSLEIKDLWFRYSPEEPWIFRGVSFNILQGEKVALTGPSGAGKSTLVNLLLRFYEYEIGTIKLGGKELKSYRPEDIRQVFGVVSQTTHLFNTTIRENLLLAKPSATEQEMWEAAKKAKIHDFIQSLPQGYDTYIGEGGYKLSGGQRQRVAIARALLKNAPILVLDEATANLDALAEREVLESLLELFQARTVLVIAHRRAPVKKMDKVIDLPSVQYE
ncbi:MAG TPA: ATP-binding cassette domain-containing protein [Peptococcaceae bacterium]|nr:ATP-binding cassette domain-containing protein [Peptococcaceae bacterium]